MAHPKADEILGQFGFLSEYGRRMEVPEGFVVIRDGDDAGSMFFILDGLVEVTKDERLLAVLEPGEVFGEMSMVDGRPRSANVAALQPTELIRIDRNDFDEAGAQNLELLRFMMEIMANRIRNTNALAAAFAPARHGVELVEHQTAPKAAEDAALSAADAALVGASAAGDRRPTAEKTSASKRPASTPVADRNPRNTERRW